MDNYVGVCESTFGFGPSILMENKKALANIQKVTSVEKALLGYTVEKVAVNCNGLEYFVEYSNNLERFMKDQGLEFHEAVDKVCEHNNIIGESVIIVVDESCTDKIDLVALKNNYDVRRI